MAARQACLLCSEEVAVSSIQRHLLEHFQSVGLFDLASMSIVRPASGNSSNSNSAVRPASSPKGNSPLAANASTSSSERQSSRTGASGSTSIPDAVVACPTCSRFVSLTQYASHIRGHELEQLTIACVACMEECPLPNVLTLPCTHRYCRDCVGRMMEVARKDNDWCSCPTCKRRLSSQELLDMKLATRGESFLKRYQEQELAGELNRPGYAVCPADCKYCVEMPPELARTPQCVDCSVCKHSFCTFCKARPYHYRIDCQAAAAARARWLAVSGALNKGDLTAWRQKMAAYEAMRQDEEEKARTAVLCPRCKRVIVRIEGCDDMVCGRDAHGGNQQSGCGHAFKHSLAPRYKATLPAVPQAGDVVRDLASITKHPDYQPCELCLKAIEGVRLECINCPAEYSCCTKCYPRLAKEHDPNHVFVVRR